MIYTEMIKFILISLISAGSIYGLFSIWCVMDFFRPKEDDGEKAFPPVSILKPIKGIDPEFNENIRSFCRQNYPEYEVLLGFTDSNDNAIPSAREIAFSEPQGKVRVVINRKNLGSNMKVSNLQGLVDEARYPLLVMSDSDMRVDQRYLKKIVGEYLSQEGVGLVTSLYKVSDPTSAGEALESLTVALDFIPSVLVARRLEGVTFGLGASMLVSRDALEELGGLSAIADYLADDFQIGNRIWKKGYKIVLSNYVIEHVVGGMSVADYLRHQVRWSRTYRASRPKGFFGYGITHAVAFALLLFIFLPSSLSLSILGATLLIRFSLCFVIYKRVVGSRKWLRWMALLPLKDLISFGIWAWSFLGRKVFWRGEYYRVAKGGKIEPA
jgi:ceramide glucosyltransferase